MTDDTTLTLSPAGRTRRNAMLSELQAEMTRVHAGRRSRRQLARSLAAALLLVVAGVGAMLALSPAGKADLAAGPTNPVVPPVVAVPAPPMRASAIEIVHTASTSIVERYAAAPSVIVEVIDDHGLLAMLADLDRPGGIVRQGGRAWVKAY